MLILYKAVEIMRQIYVISLFFLPLWCFSQLYLKPYGNQESYVYIEGGMMYIEKNIDLKKNPAGPYEASLYLRNEGQLLQGKEDENNTGNGLLSVFQEGKASAYTYNYWGSPVKISSTSLQFGNILYEPLTKTESQVVRKTSNYNGIANPLTISSRWIYKLSGREYSDWDFIGDNFDLKPGEGFTMKGVDGVNTQIRLYGVENNPGGEQRYDFRGTPNTGTISLDIVKDEILLVGNPYPSAVDLNFFLQENINTTGIAYFWDSKPVASHYLQDYEGGYGTYSPALGRNGYVPPVFQKFDNTGEAIGNTGDMGDYYARAYSPIGQGFIIEGLQTGKVYFRNRYRIFQKENPEFSEFKTPGKYPVNIDIPIVRINADFKDKYTRQLLIAFHPGSTKNIDRAMDAKNLSHLETDVGFLHNNEKYVIDVRPVPANIPLEITTPVSTEVTFSLVEDVDFNNDIFLWNSEEDFYFNLKNQQVSFPVTAGNHSGKYWITFTSSEVEKDNPVTQNEFKIFQNNQYHRAEIHAPSTPKIIGIYDTSGRKLREITGISNDYYYEIPTGNFTRGIYIVKIISGDGTIVSKKVIISNL